VTVVDPNLHDRFFLSQRIRPVVNQYDVSTLGADEKSAGEQVCFVAQKRMKLKEDLRAFTDATKTAEVFRIKAQQVWDPRARYDVTDASGQRVGQLQKAFGSSRAQPVRRPLPAVRWIRPIHRRIRRVAAHPVPLRLPHRG
jgi:hypothetical protein